MNQSMKILVVDDDPFILQTLKDKIRQQIDVEILVADSSIKLLFESSVKKLKTLL
jgi:hypothetical protein